MQDEVEEVHNQQDVSLLEAFHAGLDVNNPQGPPPSFVDDYWWPENDSDETKPLVQFIIRTQASDPCSSVCYVIPPSYVIKFLYFCLCICKNSILCNKISFLLSLYL